MQAFLVGASRCVRVPLTDMILLAIYDMVLPNSMENAELSMHQEKSKSLTSGSTHKIKSDAVHPVEVGCRSIM